MLMDEVYCARSEFDHGDPRSVYHVKGTAIAELYEEYGVDNLDDLDAAKFNVETDHVTNVWSSWGWHHCFAINGQKCGTGFQKRIRKLQNGNQDIEKRDCSFADSLGNVLECTEDTSTDDAISVGSGSSDVGGHGWMNWGEWTPCSKSCGTEGIKKRWRRCGTCNNPDENNLCTNPTDPLHKFSEDYNLHCPDTNQSETDNCMLAKCLPRSNGLPNSNPKQYLNLRGWQTYQSNGPTGEESDYEGGCIDYTVDSVGVKAINWGKKQAFVECMKHCADAGEDCLSITYWPRLKRPYWQTFWKADNEFNCFLHKKRCHEDVTNFRDAAYMVTQQSLPDAHADRFNVQGSSGYQAAAVSWYAYKDLCSNTMICDKQGPRHDPYYAATCDSTGANAFPAQPVCSCPWSQDRHSGVRAWGNPLGWHFYNEETKRIELRKNHKNDPNVTQRPIWYSERKDNGMIGVPETAMKFPCHDPCVHNKCSKSSKCVFNAESPVGYNCECTWPSAIDPDYDGHPSLAGFEGYNGCKSVDFRNSQVEDKVNI